MAHVKLDMDINKVGADHVVGTVKIRGMRRFNLKAQIAMALLRLAAWIAPVRIDVENERG